MVRGITARGKAMAERALVLPCSRCTNVYFRALKRLLPVGKFFDRTRWYWPSIWVGVFAVGSCCCYPRNW